MNNVKKLKDKAKRILKETADIANVMYESVCDVLADVGEEGFNLDHNLIYKIDQFIKLYVCISNNQYIIDGKLIDYKADIIDPLQEIIDKNEELGFFVEIEEKEQLEELKHCYDFHLIFALYFKWQVTKDTNDLSLLIDFFIYYFDGSNIFPVDIGQYSNNSIIEGSVEYVKLAEMVRAIKDYLDDYELYIQNLREFDLAESPYKNKIPYADFLLGRVGLYWGEVWVKGCGANFIIDYELNPGKYEQLLKAENLSYEEYYFITRNLSEEEKEETGKFACVVLLKNIEAINVLSHLLKDLCKNDNNYRELYRTIQFQMERIFNLIGICNFEYYDESEVEKIKLNASEYKHQLLLEMNCKLITAFNKRNLEDLSQLKKELIPLFKYDAPWFLEQFENQLNSIANQIIRFCEDEEQIQIWEEEIDKRFANNIGYSCVRNDIISTLKTAEFLYNKYIVGQTEKKDWDYSFISILYYQVLEQALNILVYKPFINEIGVGPYSEENLKEYFGKARCTEKKNGSIFAKSSLELGGCGYLLRECKFSNNFSNFFKKKYKNCDLGLIDKISENLINNIKNRRNNAAHPNIINYENAQKDKSYVYSTNATYKESIELHDLFNELLNALF